MITDLAVLDVDAGCLRVVELARQVSFDEIVERTGTPVVDISVIPLAAYPSDIAVMLADLTEVGVVGVLAEQPAAPGVRRLAPEGEQVRCVPASGRARAR